MEETSLFKVRADRPIPDEQLSHDRARSGSCLTEASSKTLKLSHLILPIVIEMKVDNSLS